MPESVWAYGLGDAVFLSQFFHNEEYHLSGELLKIMKCGGR